MVNEQFHECGSGVAEEYWKYVEKEAEFMQFTGVNDKNGTNIYEGDICLVVKNDTCSFITEKRLISFKDGRVNVGSGAVSVAVKFEVIGNIHENPELLD